jgi:hypothetical protein
VRAIVDLNTDEFRYVEPGLAGRNSILMQDALILTSLTHQAGCKKHLSVGHSLHAFCIWLRAPLGE